MSASIVTSADERAAIPYAGAQAHLRGISITEPSLRSRFSVFRVADARAYCRDPPFVLVSLRNRRRLLARVGALLMSSASACYSGIDDQAVADGGKGEDGLGDVAAHCDPDAPDAATRQGRRLSRLEYDYVIVDLFDLPPSDRFPGTFGKSKTGYSTEPAINAVGEVTVEDVMLAAEDIALALPDKLPELLPCAGTTADNACAEEYLATIGRRAFRRTLTDAEREVLLSVYQEERADEASFAEAIAVMTARLLQMPAFLYILEAPADDGEDRELSSLEVASRLSFYLWNSVPDDALLDRAEAGELEGPDAIYEEAQRMFDDSRSRRGFSRFFREWTQVVELEVASKDARVFPYLDETLANAINDSFERYVTQSVRAGATLAELLTEPKTVVNPALVDFYGVDPVDDWTTIELPADRYAGLATHPAVMAGLAHATETSYVYRGRFIRQRLLCEPVLPPPGNAMTAFNALDKPEDPTARDLSELVRARGDCQGCHDLIDPAGLALEHFDAMGKWRDAYDTGKAIETADVLRLEDGELAFAGPAELMAQIAEMPAATDCFARQVFRYEAARMETDDDACTLAEIAAALEESDGRLDEAFLALTRTDAFRFRRGG